MALTRRGLSGWGSGSRSVPSMRRGPETSRNSPGTARCPALGCWCFRAARRATSFSFAPLRGGPGGRPLRRSARPRPSRRARIAEGMSRRVKDGGDPLDDRRAVREARDGGATARPVCRERVVRAEGRASTQKNQSGRSSAISSRCSASAMSKSSNRRTSGAPSRPFATARQRCEIKTGPRGLARVTGGEGAARYACRLLHAAFDVGRFRAPDRSQPGGRCGLRHRWRARDRPRR